MPIIKIKCKVCGAEKSKWSTCKNPKHQKIVKDNIDKLYPKQQEDFLKDFYTCTH